MFSTGSLRFLLPSLTVVLLPTGGYSQGTSIDFNRDVRPILSNNCFQCHGPDEKVRKGKLRLDTKEGAFASAIVPGKPDMSSLIDRIAATDVAEVMPPPKTGKKL
ncbi:MAG TPA: c-type cytochrome domain-containing protein, partial [Gemmata sp.]|nr:c-type cytochrome domain-containing protein [Gemmata sp.]